MLDQLVPMARVMNVAIRKERAKRRKRKGVGFAKRDL